MCSGMKRPSILRDGLVRMWSDVKCHLSNYHRCIAASPISSTMPGRACAGLGQNFYVLVLRLSVASGYF